MISKRLNRILIGLAIAILPLSIIGTTTSFDAAYASSPTRYEAENATTNNADKKYVSSNGSYAFGVSGDGFVGFNGGNESSITFTVNVSDQGFYQLYVKYAVGTDSSGIKVEYNGLSQTKDFTQSNGWGSFNKTDPLEVEDVKLYKGKNTIVISRAYSDKYGEIDYIEIGECTKIDNYFDLPSGSNWVKYEAENATTDNADKKFVSSNGSYAFGVSGDGFVGFNGGSDSTITFTVSVDKNGVYELAVKYAVGMDGSGVTIECNNLSDTVAFTENNGWGSFNITDPLLTTVSLKAGSNTISVSRAYSDKYGEIDYIAIGEYIEDFDPSVTEWTRYEAENGEVVLGTRKKGSNSTVYVGNLDYDLSYIDFNLYSLEEGAYEVKVKYATDFTDKKIKIYAGERGRDGRFESYGEASLNPSGWGNFVNNVIFTVSLKENSFIRIYSRYVEIDYIEISNKVGDFFHGEGDSVQPDNDITDGGFVKLG